MTISKTFEMTEQYSAPSCKVVKTIVKRAVLAASPSDTFGVGDLTEENWE